MQLEDAPDAVLGKTLPPQPLVPELSGFQRCHRPCTQGPSHHHVYVCPCLVYPVLLTAHNRAPGLSLPKGNLHEALDSWTALLGTSSAPVLAPTPQGTVSSPSA